MVLTKFGPLAPYSQLVRTTKPVSGASSRTACSPASLVRPYTERGLVGAFTGYGATAVPSKT